MTFTKATGAGRDAYARVYDRLRKRSLRRRNVRLGWWSVWSAYSASANEARLRYKEQHASYVEGVHDALDSLYYDGDVERAAFTDGWDQGYDDGFRHGYDEGVALYDSWRGEPR